MTIDCDRNPHRRARARHTHHATVGTEWILRSFVNICDGSALTVKIAL
eukprot:SAG25_NODE_311_length_10005_cov_9.395720_3_plen_48_part_00